jgi:hypothetical protein
MLSGQFLVARPQNHIERLGSQTMRFGDILLGMRQITSCGKGFTNFIVCRN